MTAKRPPIARTLHTPLPPAKARAHARVVSLSAEESDDPGRAARALPDPDELDDGALVVVTSELRERRSLGRRLLSALGRGKTAPRSIRCSALVARGYVDVGASTDPETRDDLAWGYAPRRDA